MIIKAQSSPIFGEVNAPGIVVSRFGPDPGSAFGSMLQLAFNTLILIGGIYALFNFVLAGYAFLSAGDDPKGVQSAWAKIYQTIIGLVFLAGSFVIAGVIGLLVFGRADALLHPVLTF